MTIYQLGIVLGFLLVFLATYFIGTGQTESYNIDTGWRIMFWSELVPSTLFLVLLFLVPKSPRWLIMNNRVAEATSVLEQVQGSGQIQSTVDNITKTIQESEGALTLKEIWASGLGKVVIIGSMLSIIQAVHGYQRGSLLRC